MSSDKSMATFRFANNTHANEKPITSMPELLFHRLLACFLFYASMKFI